MNFLKSVSISLSQLLKEKRDADLGRRMIAIIVKVKSVPWRVRGFDVCFSGGSELSTPKINAPDVVFCCLLF